MATAFRSMLSGLLDRSELAGMMGMSFGHRRDLYKVLGYPSDLSLRDYKDRYERGGLAERIVEAPARATWSGGLSVVEDPSTPEKSSFDTAIEAIFKRLDVPSRILRADILAGLGRYAVLLIGAPGNLYTPLPSKLTPDQLLYLTALPESQATIARYVTNTSDSRFGLPELYALRLGTPGAIGSVNLASNVHWSRIIHVAEGALTDDIFGKPRLRAVWNNLLDLEKLVGGGAEAAWMRMNPGMQLDLDPEAKLSQAAEEDLDDEVEDYIHGISRVMRTQGIKLNLLSTTVSAFGSNVDTVLRLISATTGIPIMILTGSETGALASTQAIKNWASRIEERRREFAIALVRQIVGRLMLHKAIPTISDFDIIWSDINELNEFEKADMTVKLARANLSQRTAEGRVILSADEIRRKVWGLGASSLPVIVPEPVPTETGKKISSTFAANEDGGLEDAENNDLEEGLP